MKAWHLGEIHHLGLTVADIERSIRFYRDVLGLILVRRRSTDADYIGRQTGYPGVRLEAASFKATPESRQSIELVQYMTHAGADERPDNQPSRRRPPVLAGGRPGCGLRVAAGTRRILPFAAGGHHFRSKRGGPGGLPPRPRRLHHRAVSAAGNAARLAGPVRPSGHRRPCVPLLHLVTPRPASPGRILCCDRRAIRAAPGSSMVWAA